MLRGGTVVVCANVAPAKARSSDTQMEIPAAALLFFRMRNWPTRGGGE